jgi:hypothetical protein
MYSDIFSGVGPEVVDPRFEWPSTNTLHSNIRIYTTRCIGLPNSIFLYDFYFRTFHHIYLRYYRLKFQLQSKINKFRRTELTRDSRSSQPKCATSLTHVTFEKVSKRTVSSADSRTTENIGNDIKKGVNKLGR